MPEDLQREFHAQWSESPQHSLFPRYNLAPTDEIPVVRLRQPEHDDVETARALKLMHWGLVPFWAKAEDVPGIGNRMINARAEGVSTKPAFKAAMKRRRCLVPADGFYEWKKLQSKGSRPRKQPYLVRMADEQPFAFAGLWEFWEGQTDKGEQQILSCTILTTEPNEMMAEIHNRMPAILAPEDYEAWLDPSTEASAAAGLIEPYPAEQMLATPVSTFVNNPKHEGPRCIESADGPQLFDEAQR